MKRRTLSRVLAGFLSLVLAVPSVQGGSLNVQAQETKSQTSAFESLHDVIEDSKVSLSGYTEDDVVEFIVELEGEPLLDVKDSKVSVASFLETKKGAAALAAIEKEQSAVEKQIKKNRAAGMEVEYSYKLVMNGFAVSAPYSEKETLEEIPGVKKVSIAQTYDYVQPANGYTAATRTSGKMMDSDRANEEGYTGKGTVTAVLDTGLDINHEGFANDPESPRYTSEMVEAAVDGGELNADATAAELYKSAKIPFAYDYADKDVDVADSQGHGTHVSGSVGANTDAFSGVAPDTQIMAMKVFSDSASGASDTWIMAALEDCVVLDVDTINMSLGVGAGFTEDADDTINEVYGRVEAQGISLMCAAGNDTSSAYQNATGTDMNYVTNPDTGVVGSPSTFDAALSVASINEEVVYSEYFKAGDNKITFVDTASEDEMKFINALDGQTIEYVVIGGYGEASDFAAVDVKGKVALVARGSIAFTEKEQNAKDAGAVAMICFNNVDGEAVNMQSNGLLPMISITKADGKIMRKLEDKKITVSKEFADDISSAVGGQMSSFSNIGVAPDMSLKPEITAPGGNVYSTTVGGSYGNMSGTSMASPHMAGAASVMRQYVNEAFASLSSVEKQELINNLLMSTAVPVEDTEGVYYTPRKQGSGLAEVYNAIHTDAYLTVNGDRPKAELGDNENGTFSFEFEITNIGETELTYDLSAAPLTAKEEEVAGEKYVSESSRVLPESEFSVTFSQDKVTVPAGETVKVTVDMQLTEEGKAKLADFTNGTFLDGFIMVEAAAEGGIDLSLPYLGFYGNWADAPIYDATIYDEEAPVTYEMPAMYQIDITDYTGYPLGVNLLSGDLNAADANKIAVASRQLQYDRLFPIVGMLRASKATSYSVLTSDGIEVFGMDAENVSKSYYYSSGGFFTYDMPMEGWAPIYLDEDGYYYYLADGQYTYEITGHVDGTEDGEQSISFPITIDNEQPEVVSHRYYEEDGVPYLEVTMKDNHYLMGAQLCDETGEYAVSNAYAIEHETAGEEVTLTFDLTAARELGVEVGCVLMIDYAMNEGLSQTYSFTSQEMEVRSVSINQQQITCRVDSQPFQLTATVTPSDAVDQTLTWSSDNEDVVTIAQDGWVTLVGPGVATITATAANGVYGTTTITVNEATTAVKDLPSDLVIRENGRYRLPEDLSSVVTITDNAKNVTVVGDSAKTAENPYKNIGFKSEVSNLNLTIENLNVNSSSKSVVEVTGEGNTLTINGENTLVAEKYCSKALINVAEGTELTVKGNGTLNLQINESTYAAGIGANAGKVAGKITIDGGNINGYTIGSGSVIGGSGCGVEKITINGGVLDVSVPYSEAGYGGNLSNCAAAIGDGNVTYKTGKMTIEINGGEITGSTEVQAAVIGTGHKSQIAATVTINGGKLNLKSTSGNGDLTVGGACIGTGDQCTALSRITINGGEIIAATESGAAAIGGGAGTSGCTVMINGGTVTASTATSGVPAIGRGCYISSGTDGALMITGGSLKAISTAADTAALPFSAIQNDDYENVFETLFSAADVTSVTVDGKDFKVTANHPEDDDLHLWLTEGKHDVKITTANGNYNYEAELTSTGKSYIQQYYTVSYDLTDLTVDGAEKAYAEKSYSAVLTAAEGKELPETVSVTMNGVETEVSYDAETGKFTVENVTGDLVVTAAAEDAEVVVIDKAALEEAITAAEELTEENYTAESWAAFAEALEDAKAVLADEEADQKTVDAALAALTAAKEALAEKEEEKEPADATDDSKDVPVEMYITSAGSTQTGGSTGSAIDGDYSTFWEVAWDIGATNPELLWYQIELEEAVELEALRYYPRSGSNQGSSNGFITDYQVLVSNDGEEWTVVSEGSWEMTTEWKIAEFDSPVTAKYVRLFATGTYADVGNNTNMSIAEIRVKSVEKVDYVPAVKKDTLEAAINKAEALSATDYVDFTAVEEALAAAKAVYANEEATQEEADAAAATLNAAVKALVKLATETDKANLKEAIDKAKALNAADYVDFTAVEEALTAAEEVYANEKASQSEVKAATNKLNKAIKALVEVVVEENEVVRLYGSDRYATGMAAADELKSVLGVEKFDTVVIATGKGYADALSGSYLAAVKNAPILLTSGKTANIAELHAYIKENVTAGGKVYILGGESAVPEAVEAIEGYDVVRLKGGNRYETNLAILAEAGYEGQEDLLVATGKDFADSLSASAAARPILLVKPDATLTDDQKAVAANFANIYVIGGEGAVSAATAEELAAYGNVTRLSGSDRYETSVAVAEAFFTDPETVVLAYGKNYPDGLCGGALAAALNAPLILTKEGSEDAAAAYVAANGIASGYVLGGDGVLPNDTVVTVFGLESADEIIKR